MITPDAAANPATTATHQTPGLDADLRAGGKGHEFAIAGWSYPETEYTWTLGNRSLIRLPSQGLTSDHALRLRVGPMLRAGAVAYQRLIVAVNGTPLAQLVCRAATSFEIYVPARCFDGFPAVDIELHLPDAVAPSALGGSGDTRELGVWVSSVHLAPLANAHTSNPSRTADKAILMDMQSLGENCELGFVQRAGGAEPIGLFRWALTPLPRLLQALEARFEGLGAPGTLDVEVDEGSEFQVIDRRFGFRNHSFAFAKSGAKREEVLRRELTRLPYMARLLIEDLERADKLFCFQDASVSGQADVEDLVAALGRYGPNTLLWVTLADSPTRRGTAERLNDRLIRGYIDRFEPGVNVREPSIESWLAVIRSAHALWRSECP